MVVMTVGMTFATVAQTKTKNEADLFKMDGVDYLYKGVVYLQFIHSAEPVDILTNDHNSTSEKELELVYNYMTSQSFGDPVHIEGTTGCTLDEIIGSIIDGETVYMVFKKDGCMMSFLADETDVILTIK